MTKHGMTKLSQLNVLSCSYANLDTYSSLTSLLLGDLPHPVLPCYILKLKESMVGSGLAVAEYQLNIIQNYVWMRLHIFSI